MILSALLLITFLRFLNRTSSSDLCSLGSCSWHPSHSHSFSPLRNENKIQLSKKKPKAKKWTLKVPYHYQYQTDFSSNGRQIQKWCAWKWWFHERFGISILRRLSFSHPLRRFATFSLSSGEALTLEALSKSSKTSSCSISSTGTKMVIWASEK